MKNVFKTFFCFCLISSGFVANAQTTGNVVVPRPATAMLETPAQPANVNAKEVTVTLRNNAEKSVAVFAGPKENLKEPKVLVAGGLSKNTLYLKELDAVCLMTVDKRPLACTIIKPGVTTVEVNTSANAISSK
jgi:hypothetical protein